MSEGVAFGGYRGSLTRTLSSPTSWLRFVTISTTNLRDHELTLTTKVAVSILYYGSRQAILQFPALRCGGGQQ